MAANYDNHDVSSFALGGDIEVHRLGYGAMRLTGPGNFGPPEDRASAVTVVRTAAECGVNFFDTADAYGPGASEEILAEALGPVRDKVVIATKGGAVKTAPGKVHWNGRPEYLREALHASLRRLGTDRIDLYYLHRPDPKVPFRDSVGALAALRDEGKIRHVGLSNVSLEQLEEALEIVPVAAVQNVYSLLRREHEALLQFTEARGIAFVSYAPLAAAPFERRAPLADPRSPLASIAKDLGATPTQLALAWLLHRSPSLLTIPGTSRVKHLLENVAAAQIALDGSLIRRIERAIA
ncbi:MAG: aldo/keto reductase [Myxococcota bacterium]